MHLDSEFLDWLIHVLMYQSSVVVNMGLRFSVTDSFVVDCGLLGVAPCDYSRHLHFLGNLKSQKDFVGQRRNSTNPFWKFVLPIQCTAVISLKQIRYRPICDVSVICATGLI
jgi:hypothetical protein